MRFFDPADVARLLGLPPHPCYTHKLVGAAVSVPGLQILESNYFNFHFDFAEGQNTNISASFFGKYQNTDVFYIFTSTLAKSEKFREDLMRIKQKHGKICSTLTTT